MYTAPIVAFERPPTMVLVIDMKSLMKTNLISSRALPAFVLGLLALVGNASVNAAPTVSIINPTNGSVFILPGSFALSAEVSGFAGTVTNVEFFNGTNKLGGATQGNPYVLNLSKFGLGTYVLTAQVTDDGGIIATSAPVTVTVKAQLPIEFLSELQFNPQTGFYEQNVRVSNASLSTVERMRLYIYGLDETTTVQNSKGKGKRTPYLQSSGSIPPGGYVDMLIQYHQTGTGVPHPTLVAAAVGAGGPRMMSVAGTGVHINRGVANCDGSFMLEFPAELNRFYCVSYSSDLKNWKTVPAAIAGNGTLMCWYDCGNPQTECAPSQATARFYRVCALPQFMNASYHRSATADLHAKNNSSILNVSEAGVVCLDVSNP